MEEATTPIILHSARKHGVADADMLHAHHHPIRIVRQADGMTMFIGGDRDGQLLEVGVVTSSEGVALLIHAMPARAKYLR
jgi:hypothetical protein